MDTEKEIEAIHERNRKVALDKAWEGSFVRRAFIIAVTYIAAYVLLFGIGVERPKLGALVPCLGYLISTLSLPPLRIFWEKWNR